MKIGLFSDPHYCTLKFDDDRKPELSLNKIKSMLEDFKRQSVELIICLGDLLHCEPNKNQNLENLKIISSIIKSYNISFVLIPGNHDSEIFTKEEYSSVSGFDVAPLKFETKHYKLILLDACCNDDGSLHIPPENDWTNSYVPVSQIEWLKNELSDKSKKCIVFTHQCLDFNVECHHLIRNAVLINSIIDDAGNVESVYSGHYHPGKESKRNNINYITLKAVVCGDGNPYRIIEIL